MEVPLIRIKGTILQARLALVESLAPGNGMTRVLARLSPEDQRVLKALLSASWYPFDLGQRLDDAIVKEIGGGRPEFFEKMGAASAEKNLGPGGVHRSFLVPGDPHGFLAMTPMVYAHYYDKGRREYQKTGDKEAVLTTYDAETFSAPDCATVVGWYRKALEMCGAKNVRVVEEECRAQRGAVCRYRLSWS